MATSQEKWKISAFSAVLFFIVASPFLYSLVNSITSRLGLPIANNGCPTYLGLFIHALVFMLLVRLSMDYQLFN
jgi:hypothetical protein